MMPSPVGRIVLLIACLLGGAAIPLSEAQEIPRKGATTPPRARCRHDWYRTGEDLHKICQACLMPPYRTSSYLYGYQDYAPMRGPVINLGGATLEPGFRGYGVIGSPGYGLGIRPQSAIDLQLKRHF